MASIFPGIPKTLNVRFRQSDPAPNNKNSDILGEALQFDGDKEYNTGDTFLTSVSIWVVPPGEAYSQFEKMFLPFDVGTWIAICLTFLFTFITVQLIKFCSMKVENFVFGRNFR